MKQNRDFLEIFKGALAAVALLFLLVAFFTCCTVIRGKKSSSSDSTSVVKKDSGSLIKSDIAESKMKDYERVTYIFPKDTNVINYHTYPKTIIYEKGKQQESKTQTIYDSSWKKEIDSLKVRLANSQLNTKTKVFDFWQILAIGLLGIIVLYFISTKLSISIKKPL